MSAYIVSKETIDVLLSAARQYGGRDARYLFSENGRYLGSTQLQNASQSELNKVGKALWAENHKSVNDRNNEENDTTELDAYQFKSYQIRKPGHLSNVIRCYEYQSCEHEGWQTSDAKRFCDELKKSLIKQLPGANESPWGIHDEEELKAITA